MNKPCADRFTHFLKIDSCQCGKPAGNPAGAAWSGCHQQGPRCRQPAVRAGGRPRQLCDQTGGRDSLFSDAQNLYKHISDIFPHSYTYIKLFRLQPIFSNTPFVPILNSSHSQVVRPSHRRHIQHTQYIITICLYVFFFRKAFRFPRTPLFLQVNFIYVPTEPTNRPIIDRS